MPVDFLHAIIAVIFFSVWVVISQIAFGNQPREAHHNAKSAPHGSQVSKGQLH